MLIKEQDLSKIDVTVVDTLTSTLDTNLISLLNRELRPYLSANLRDRYDLRVDIHENWSKDINLTYLNMVFNCNKDLILFSREYSTLDEQNKAEFIVTIKAVKDFLDSNEEFLEAKKDMFDRIVNKFVEKGIDPTLVIENRASIETKYGYSTTIYKLRQHHFIIDAIYEGLVVV